MDIRPIRSDEDCTAALAEIERLWGAAEGTPEGDKLDVLATLVDAFESRTWGLHDGTPLDSLRFLVFDAGRSQKALADMLGSRSQASDVLRGRRRLSLAMAQKVSAAWNIPIQLLVTPYELKVA